MTPSQGIFPLKKNGYNVSVYCNFSSQDNLRLEYEINQGSLGIFRLKGGLRHGAKTESDSISLV